MEPAMHMQNTSCMFCVYSTQQVPALRMCAACPVCCVFEHENENENECERLQQVRQLQAGKRKLQAVEWRQVRFRNVSGWGPTTAFSKDSKQKMKKWRKLKYLANTPDSLAPCPLRDCAPRPNLPLRTLSAYKHKMVSVKTLRQPQRLASSESNQL